MCLKIQPILYIIILKKKTTSGIQSQTTWDFLKPSPHWKNLFWCYTVHAEKCLVYLISSIENHCRIDLKSVYIFFIQVLHTSFKIAKSRCNALGNVITMWGLSPHIQFLTFSFLVRCSHNYPVALKLLIFSQHTEAPKSATPQLQPRLSPASD